MASDAEKIVAEYEYFRAQADAYKQNIDMINSHLAELSMVKDSLEQVGSLAQENEILVPLGAESFVRAKVVDTQNVIIGIGAEVAVKKTIAQAKQDVENRAKELEKVRAEHAEKLQLITRRLEELAPVVQQILAQVQKEGV